MSTGNYSFDDKCFLAFGDKEDSPDDKRIRVRILLIVKTFSERVPFVDKPLSKKCCVRVIMRG